VSTRNVIIRDVVSCGSWRSEALGWEFRGHHTGCASTHGCVADRLAKVTSQYTGAEAGGLESVARSGLEGKNQ